MRFALLALLALVAAPLLVGSCSSDDGAAAPPPPSPTTTAPTPAAASWPVCEELWVEGGTLPRDYDGCRHAAGGVWTANAWECLDGVTSIVSYVDRDLWAVPGRTIHRHPPGTLADDEAFMAVFRRCGDRDGGRPQ